MIRMKSDKAMGGALLLAIAAAFAWAGRDLPVGRAIRMGPGWAPMALSILLAALGAALFLRGLFERSPAEPAAPWPLRGVVPVLGSILLFGYAIESLGLLMASVLCVFVAALGAADFKLREAALVSLGLAVGVSLLFVTGLGLPVKILP